ncbi:hypothetical protein V6575_10640 [Roseibium sp. H3510]|uniref:Uncharacterized protein n=1 Tax=Roseibium algae TaxID=3123038 RepID=A0ABU8TK55_9HYPH
MIAKIVGEPIEGWVQAIVRMFINIAACLVTPVVVEIVYVSRDEECQSIKWQDVCQEYFRIENKKKSDQCEQQEVFRQSPAVVDGLFLVFEAVS